MRHDLIEIRQAAPADAEDISTVVLRCLRETNASYYDADVLASIAANFSPAQIAARMADRTVLVAVADAIIIGTASLQGSWVRSVFVRPDRQGGGVGARLMDAIEHLAGTRGVDQMTVPSSINAEGFYRRLGFAHLRDELHGQERVILMTKMVAARPNQGELR